MHITLTEHDREMYTRELRELERALSQIATGRPIQVRASDGRMVSYSNTRGDMDRIRARIGDLKGALGITTGLGRRGHASPVRF